MSGKYSHFTRKFSWKLTTRHFWNTPSTIIKKKQCSRLTINQSAAHSAIGPADLVGQPSRSNRFVIIQNKQALDAAKTRPGSGASAWINIFLDKRRYTASLRALLKTIPTPWG
ncbi:hypothetical protein GWI33_007673 [Rhynchophorus ferrugineus]|uniref:Uncharacterized protein n=1 Tax=Rhynchophorus ferrugineus TaxID=354439 RepID=A0A834II80_RHYFE|nr:hypothetical protein GWI33_007673 [Rhynchophorus ferrugineus]